MADHKEKALPLSSSSSFRSIPLHLVIHAIIMPFYDLKSKLQLLNLCKAYKAACEENIINDKRVKAELIQLLQVRYQETFDPNTLFNKTLLLRLREFMKSEQGIIHFSKLFLIDQAHRWHSPDNIGLAIQAIIKHLITFESLFGRKLYQLAKNKPDACDSYRKVWKEALELLNEPSRTENKFSIFNFRVNFRDNIIELYDRICLLIYYIDLMVPTVKTAQQPKYLFNYYIGLNNFGQHLKALLAPEGPQAYLSNLLAQAPATMKTG